MSDTAVEVAPELLELLRANRERRQRLKLEVLASLRFPPRLEEVNQPRGRRMTSEAVLELAKVTNVGGDLSEKVLPARDELKARFVVSLLNTREAKELKVKHGDEIQKMKEVHSQARLEIKQQGEAIKLVRNKNRRLRRLLQGLQTRLVASMIALQFQMDRKIQLAKRLENIIYYRDTVMDNAFAFLFGQYRPDPTIPLGGVFSPLAFIDYNDEEERVEREYALLISLTPASFKSGAQQRRVSLRNALSEGLSYRSSFHSDRTESIDYSSLSRYTYFSTSPSGGSPSTSREIDGRRGSVEDGHSNGGVIAASVLDTAPGAKRLTVGKGLKPSHSAGPTKHEVSGTKKSAGGLFGIFKPR